MRFLLLSDIHANATALDACLETVKGRWDRIFCLGDIVDYGPDPNEVTDKVRELAPVILVSARRWRMAGASITAG